MKKLYLFAKIFVFFIIFVILFNIGLYVFAYITPKTPLKTANQISFYDKDNSLIHSNLDNSKWIKYNKISKNIINATIATEDKNFFNHKGFDYARIIKAFFINIKRNNLNQGASTISQQYIKNLYLNFDKKLSRKIEEAYLTFELETHYNKKQIIEGYLNTINYGAGCYGINNASKYYFNKNADKLSLAEATLIVGIPKNPTKYNPVINYNNAKKRQKIVLNSMVKNGYISKKIANETYKKEVELVKNELDRDFINVNYYTDAVLAELNSLNEIPDSLIKGGGLKIYTTFDKNAMNCLEKSINNEMNDINNLQVAALVAEPKTGNITALIGGKNYKESEYNRVIQAKRQVGSTIKPFLYYSALENGLTASSTFSSERTTFTVEKNKTYSPQNYNNLYPNKEITMASAIAYSDNIYAVKTHLFLGEDVLGNTLSMSGIKEFVKPTASLALGTSEISMIDFANGYLTLANYGVKNKAHFIRKVTDYHGNILYQYKPEEVEIFDKNSLFILNELLSNTYNYNFVDYASPTMISVSNKITKKYAVKSGSTDNDYWTIGYNPDALVMVWNGKDDNSKLDRKDSKISKNIWVNTIEGVLKEKESNWYQIPKNIIAKEVNPISGIRENNRKNLTIYYLKGTEPYN